jgi:DNA-binding MarR family transcriptional regulator
MSEIRVELRSHRTEEMSVPQFRILAAVRDGARTNKDISDLIGVNVATMSRMVQGLEADGLLEKTVSLVDRREVRIKLSKLGVKLYDKLLSHARDKMADRFSELSASDRETMRKGLEVLLRSMESASSTPS